MLKKAQEVIASGNVRTVVDFGIELDREIKDERKELEVIKDFLRKIGETSLADRRTEKTVDVHGNLGSVSITYPADRPKVKSNVDILAAEPGIPEAVFKVLFTKRVVVELAEGFLEKLENLSDEDREMIFNLVEIESSTPRVNWPK